MRFLACVPLALVALVANPLAETEIRHKSGTECLGDSERCANNFHACCWSRAAASLPS